MNWKNGIYLLAVVLGMATTPYLAACGDDGEEEQDIEQPGKDKENEQGKIEAVTLILDEHTATATHPAIVTAASPTTVAMSLATTYTEPDGTTYRAEPKASVKLAAAADTVFAESIQQLVALSRTKDTSNQHTTGETVSTESLQQFTLGNQQIDFQIAYERIDHRNSAGKTVTLPYMRLSSAKPGQPSTAETRSAMQPHATAIRLRPLPTTRGSITTQQAYAVSVIFTIDATPTATTDQSTAVRTLTFQVDYVGIVEETTEYPDPQLTFDYHITPLSGTSSAASPFVLNDGAAAMVVAMEQTCSYTWFDTNSMEQRIAYCSPQAQVTLSAELDTVWVVDKEDLTKVTPFEPTITSSGENPAIIQGSQVLEISKQKLTLNWSYEQYADLQIEDQTVSWPYIKLDAPRIVDVTKQVIPGAYIPNMQAAVYNVTVKLAQDLSTPGASPEQNETVEYLIRYIGVEAVQLTNVAYRKDYKLYEPHDNLPLRAQYILYRDRTYSNGQTYTDEFASNLTAISEVAFAAGRQMESDTGKDFEWMLPEGGKILYHAENENLKYIDLAYRSRGGISVKTGVSDLSKLDTLTREDNYNRGAPMENLSMYHVVNQDGWYNPENPPDAWCWRDVPRQQCVWLKYGDTPIRDYVLIFRFYDKFRWLDGQLFDFLEYQMTYDFEFKIEDTVMPDNITPAKVFTHIGRYHYLGREGEYITVDTVYQIK